MKQSDARKSNDLSGLYATSVTRHKNHFSVWLPFKRVGVGCGGELKNDSATTLAVTKLAHINLCLCRFTVQYHPPTTHLLTLKLHLLSHLQLGVKKGEGVVFTIEGVSRPRSMDHALGD